MADRRSRRPVAVHLFGAWLGDARGARDALQPFLHALASEPASAQLTHLAYRDAKRYLADHGPGDTAMKESQAPTATAFPHRSASFLLKHEVLVDARSDRHGRAARDWLARSWALVHPFGTGAVYANFPDPDLAEPAAYHGSNLPRRRSVKAAYDPGNLFRFHQSIPPAGT